MLPTFLLANVFTASPPSGEQVFFAYFLGALGTLLGLVLVALKIWDITRRKPPVSEELAAYQRTVAEKYATREELREETVTIAGEIMKLRQERSVSVANLHTKIDNLDRATARSFADVERSLGRIEGALKT